MAENKKAAEDDENVEYGDEYRCHGTEEKKVADARGREACQFACIWVSWTR